MLINISDVIFKEVRYGVCKEDYKEDTGKEENN